MIINACGFETGSILEAYAATGATITTDAATGNYAAAVEASGKISFWIGDSATRPDRAVCFGFQQSSPDQGSFTLRFHFGVSSYYDVIFQHDPDNQVFNSSVVGGSTPVTNIAWQAIPDTYFQMGKWVHLSVQYYAHTPMAPGGSFVIEGTGFSFAVMLMSFIANDDPNLNAGFSYVEFMNTGMPFLIDDLVIVDKTFMPTPTQSQAILYRAHDLYDLRVYPIPLSAEVVTATVPDGFSDANITALSAGGLLGDHYTLLDASAGYRASLDQYALENWTPPEEITGFWKLTTGASTAASLGSTPSPFVAGMLMSAAAKVTGGAGSLSFGLATSVGVNYGSGAYSLTSSYKVYSAIVETFDPISFRPGWADSFVAGIAEDAAAGAAVYTTRFVTCIVVFVSTRFRRLIGDGGLDITFDWNTPGAYSVRQLYFTINTSVNPKYAGGDLAGGYMQLSLTYTGNGAGTSGDSLYLGVTDFNVNSNLPGGFYNENYKRTNTIPAKVSIRIIMHSKFISFYINDSWIHTFTFDYMSYADSTTLSVSSGYYGTYLYNLLVAELSDWREAVWIDYHQTGESAISSIIQERPISTLPRSDGAVGYFMAPPLGVDPLELAHIQRHTITDSLAGNSASDALVYASEVSAVNNLFYLENYGFTTDILQLSNLDHGARQSAKYILHKGAEQMQMHTILARADLSIEQGDLVRVGYTRSGTLGTNLYDIIVEACEISFSPDQMQMQITGRSYIP